MALYALPGFAADDGADLEELIITARRTLAPGLGVETLDSAEIARRREDVGAERERDLGRRSGDHRDRGRPVTVITVPAQRAACLGGEGAVAPRGHPLRPVPAVLPRHWSNSGQTAFQ